MSLLLTDAVHDMHHDDAESMQTPYESYEVLSWLVAFGIWSA